MYPGLNNCHGRVFSLFEQATYLENFEKAKGALYQGRREERGKVIDVNTKTRVVKKDGALLAPLVHSMGDKDSLLPWWIQVRTRASIGLLRKG